MIRCKRLLCCVRNDGGAISFIGAYMKNCRNILALIAAIFSVLFFSCSNLQQYEKVTDGKAHIYLKLDSNVRSVNPEKMNLEDFDKFSLEGKLLSSEEEKTETLATWESDSEETENAKSAYAKMASDTSLLCDAGGWTFTLTACRNAIAVYSSEITKTVYLGQNELSFSLTALKTGTGSVQIKLSFEKDEQIKAVEAGLYSYSGNAETAAEEFALEKLEIQDDSASGKSFVLYEKSSAPSGNYIAKFFFYRDESCAEQIQFPYTTLVKVRDGRKSLADVETSVEHLYSISYELDGGTWSNSADYPETFKKWQSVSITSAPEKSEYTFAGWYFGSDFTESALISGETSEPGEKAYGWEAGEKAVDITLWAKWIENSLAIPAISLSAPVYSDIENLLSASAATAAEEEDIVFTAKDGYESYQWTVDDEAQAGTEKTFAMNASDFSAGKHFVSLTVSDGKHYYSASAEVTVKR